MEKKNEGAKNSMAQWLIYRVAPAVGTDGRRGNAQLQLWHFGPPDALLGGVAVANASELQNPLFDVESKTEGASRMILGNTVGRLPTRATNSRRRGCRAARVS